MADVVRKPNTRAQLLSNTIEVPDFDGLAGRVLKQIQTNRKDLDKWEARQQKALEKLKAYKKAFDAAHKDISGCKGRDERLSKKWVGLANKIIRLQAMAKGGKGKGGKDPDKEIRALHAKAAAIYDEIDDQMSRLIEKYDKLSDKLVRGLNNLPY